MNILINLLLKLFVVFNSLLNIEILVVFIMLKNFDVILLFWVYLNIFWDIFFIFFEILLKKGCKFCIVVLIVFKLFVRVVNIVDWFCFIILVYVDFMLFKVFLYLFVVELVCKVLLLSIFIVLIVIVLNVIKLVLVIVIVLFKVSILLVNILIVFNSVNIIGIMFVIIGIKILKDEVSNLLIILEFIVLNIWNILVKFFICFWKLLFVFIM